MSKYLTVCKTENGYGELGVCFGDHIFSLLNENGKIIIREECDGYYFEELTKDEATELFQEAIEWIKKS